MSFFAGLYYHDGRIASELELGLMTANATPWMPDAQGAWCAGSVGLASRQLHVTPESLNERLPLVGQRGCVLTGDFRIDNREELIGKLRLGDRPAREITDGELILGAYAAWQDACPEHLLGDFAFALWDPARRALFCGRDAMGVKPFFYHAAPQGFYFASSLGALLQLKEIPRRFNELCIADLITNQFSSHESSFYQDIQRLPPGHAMVIEPGRQRQWEWWSLDTRRELRLRSQEDYEEAMHDVFAQAVRCRLRSIHPVGTMLSGGLDSSSVTCMARHLLKGSGAERLHAFSAVFPALAQAHPEIDERRFQQAVVAGGELVHHPLVLDEAVPLYDFLWSQDEPNRSYNSYIDRAAYLRAHELGIRVMLTGIDGDTIVSNGLCYLMELFRRGRWLRLCRAARGFALRHGSSTRRLIWLYGLRPHIPEKIFGIRAAIQGGARPQLDELYPISADFLQRLQRDHGYAEREEPAGSYFWSAREWHRDAIRAPFLRYLNEVLRPLGEAAGLEVRHPFFDRRLIEFCLAVPWAERLRGGENRSLMRRALSGLLPEEVRQRPGKAHLSANFYRNLTSGNGGVIENFLNGAPEAVQRYLDLSKLRAAWARCRSRPQRSSQEAITIFRCVVLGRWLCRILNNAGEALI